MKNIKAARASRASLLILLSVTAGLSPSQQEVVPEKPEAILEKPEATLVKPEAVPEQPEAILAKPEATLVKPEAVPEQPEQTDRDNSAIDVTQQDTSTVDVATVPVDLTTKGSSTEEELNADRQPVLDDAKTEAAAESDASYTVEDLAPPDRLNESPTVGELIADEVLEKLTNSGAVLSSTAEDSGAIETSIPAPESKTSSGRDVYITFYSHPLPIMAHVPPMLPIIR